MRKGTESKIKGEGKIQRQTQTGPQLKGKAGTEAAAVSHLGGRRQPWGPDPRRKLGGAVREEGHRASSVLDTLGLRGFKEPLTQELEIRDLEPESSI